jgi:hypothetical protein
MRPEEGKMRSKKAQALKRFFAREAEEINKEERLERGLRRGLYACKVCGQRRGWYISKGPFRYINADKLPAFRCCDCNCFKEHSGIWGIVVEAR